MDAQDVIRLFREANAVVANAKSQLARLSLKLFDVALASLSEAMERGKDAHSGVAVQAANVGAGAFGPGDFLHA